MKFNKKNLCLFGVGVLAIAPVALVSACANSELKKSPTILKSKKFKSKNLNLDQDLKISLNQIKPSWLLANKNKIFQGELSYFNSEKQVENFQVNVDSQNQVNVEFNLVSGAYIDNFGEISTKNWTINFVINGFKLNDDQPEIIDLEEIVNQATFDVDSKLKQGFASAVQLKDLKWNEENLNNQLGLKINHLFPDDSVGKLGFNFSFYQKNLTTNYLTINVLSTDDKAISGFKIKPVESGDEQIVNQEINRLKQTNVIDVTKLTSLEIIQYQEQPQQFIANLINLDFAKFSYDVLSFESKDLSNNKSMITILLQVSYKSAKALLRLSKEIEVLNVNINNPNLVRATELNRLNNLAKNSYLLKTSFNENEIKSLEKNPTDLLKIIFNFVSQQYFHYHVDQMKIVPIKNDGNTISAQLNFVIQAKYWKTVEQIKPIITSKQFSYPITISYHADVPVPEPTPAGWEITPSDKATPVKDDNGDVMEGSYGLEIDLQNNNQFDLALIDWNNGDQVEAMVKAIFKDRQDWFIKQTGDLPDNWNWDNYTTFYDFIPTVDNNLKKINGWTVESQFEYVDSKDLSKWFAISIKFINGYNSGKELPKPDAKSTWDKIQAQFEDLVKKQNFDENKLHQGLNGVYSFAQIGVDNPVKGDYFANFLNFSITEFIKKWGFFVDVEISDASINYLTNAVEFKWHLKGQKDLDQYKWDSELVKIQYQPSGNWKDSIQFDDQGDLAISNSTSINNILDRFTFGNEFIPKNLLSEKFDRFGANWTWKARELANYVRFTFYQAFNNGASAINMAIENLPNAKLNENPGNYTIVLKAKLNSQAQGNYLPYLQMFGLGLGIQPKSWQVNDLIEIRLDVIEPSLRPDVVTDGNEIFPGMNPGAVLGTGQGAVSAYLNTPPRTDLYSISLGKTNLKINHNKQSYVNANANHRFLALNMLSRYDFKDPLWSSSEPPLLPGWTK